MYVTDAGQTTHFQSVFTCVEKAGNINGVRVHHVGFGVVVAEDKKKFLDQDTRIRSIARTAKVSNKQLEEANILKRSCSKEQAAVNSNCITNIAQTLEHCQGDACLASPLHHHRRQHLQASEVLETIQSQASFFA